MIPFKKINGTWKTPSVIFGKAFGVWHSLGDGGSSGGGDNEPTIPIDYYDLFMPTATPSAGYGVVSKLVKLEAGDVITFVQTGSDSIFRNEFSLYTGDVQEGKYPAHYYENLTAIWSNLGFTGTAEVTIEQDGLYCFNAYNGIAFDSIMVTKAFALEAFNEALKLVGLGKVDSLSMVLASSEMCTALAGNAKAVAIMKAYYGADMASAIDSNWNDGLNLLNYKCGLKCYIYKYGSQCSNITGGWSQSSTSKCHFDYSMTTGSGTYNGIYFSDKSNCVTTNVCIDATVFGKVKINVIWGCSGSTNYYNLWNSSNTTMKYGSLSAGTVTVDTSGTGATKFRLTMEGDSEYIVGSVWLEP